MVNIDDNDKINIDDDNHLLSGESDQELDQKNKFPILIADDTIQNEDDVAAYAATLVNGERQCLIYDRKMYLTDGTGGMEKITGSEDIDTSRLVTKEEFNTTLSIYDSDQDGVIDKAKILEGMTENDLSQLLTIFDAIKSSNPQQYLGTNLENKLGMYYLPINQNKRSSLEQKVALNVSNGQIIQIESAIDIEEQKALVQVYKYIEGEQDTVHTLKEFNNANKENFIYSDNVEFDDTCYIKNKYVLQNTLNDSTGLYETKFNKAEFLDLFSLTSEVNE